WTKFVDSPTSSVSSPGPKPVNFDFHKSAVEQDPKILHPVPLRVTPESQPLPGTEEEPCRSPRKLTDPQPIPYEQLSIGDRAGSPKRETNNNSTTGVAAADIRPIQRPQPKKPCRSVLWKYAVSLMRCFVQHLVQEPFPLLPSRPRYPPQMIWEPPTRDQ
ncbi:unnamed protein product, partial [Timema podura]|nr:unnamed protein product [Timema podura]